MQKIEADDHIRCYLGNGRLYKKERGRKMKIFIDSANMKEIIRANELGVIDGATTNPTHISREIARTGKTFEEIIRDICAVVDGPVSAEVVSLDSQSMIEEAQALAGIHSNVTVKLPITQEALKAVKILSREGIKTNVTLIFSANQAILAARAGATFVSPFVARLDNIGQVGTDLIEDIMTIFRNYDFATEVIVASLTNPRWVTDAALTGAHIVTLPFDTFSKLTDHPLTDIGVEKFLEDWGAVSAKA